MCRMETWLLEDYAEGVLGLAETTILEAHLRVCDACRQELTHIKLLFWELENLRREPVEIPAEVAAIETAILGEWLRDRESWIQHAGTRFNSTVKQVGRLVGSSLKQTADIAGQIPGTRAAAEVVGATSRKTAKWLGKAAYRQLRKSVSGLVKDPGSALMNLMGGG
jgi:hypothetical protein